VGERLLAEIIAFVTTAIAGRECRQTGRYRDGRAYARRPMSRSSWAGSFWCVSRCFNPQERAGTSAPPLRLRESSMRRARSPRAVSPSTQLPAPRRGSRIGRRTRHQGRPQHVARTPKPAAAARATIAMERRGIRCSCGAIAVMRLAYRTRAAGKGLTDENFEVW
jgi:hypothetical protein